MEMVRFHSIHEATGHKNVDNTETDLKVFCLPLVAGIMLQWGNSRVTNNISFLPCWAATLDSSHQLWPTGAVWPWKYFNWFQITRSDAGRKCALHPNTGFWYSCIGCNQISTLSSRSLYRYVTDKGCGCRVLLVLLFGSKLHGYL